ncbi:MAG TPA: nucleoside triphosphate pyrophosphohydrolase [Longimicrobiaceae bacterium]|nr:nucleoside triphosphate pyrophosphohydrolase [Longimicrobiaceae bacterium]
MNPSQPETPPPAGTSGGTLDRALALAAFLRAHCPWDAAQTTRSLQPCLLEEAHEAAHAIAAGDAEATRDELGDLLLNLAFQIVLAEEAGSFGRGEVVERVEQKMRRRHPHLYGGEPEAWSAIKARERAERGAAESILDGVPAGLDPLSRAFRVQARVAEFGFDWSDWRGAWDKVHEEVGEVRHELEAGDAARLEDELGDLLFAVVNLARLAGAHPTAALARANAKFERRFAGVEALAAERGVVFGQATLEELDVLWDEVKRRERASAGAARETPGE